MTWNDELYLLDAKAPSGATASMEVIQGKNELLQAAAEYIRSDHTVTIYKCVGMTLDQVRESPKSEMFEKYVLGVNHTPQSDATKTLNLIQGRDTLIRKASNALDNGNDTQIFKCIRAEYEIETSITVSLE